MISNVGVNDERSFDMVQVDQKVLEVDSHEEQLSFASEAPTIK